jgi:hypothetical protein
MKVMPTHTMFVSAALIITYVLSFFISDELCYLLFNGKQIFGHFQIWRVLLSPYITISTFELMALLFIYLPYAYFREM